MGEEDPGVEAVRVMSGDHGVEVLQDILSELGESAFRRVYTVAQAMVHKTA